MSIHGHLRACSVASPDFFSPFFHAYWCSPLGVSGENTLLPAPTPLLCSCQLRDAQKMSVCLLPGHSWQLSSSSGTCAAATGAGEEREVSWGGGEYSDAVFLGNGWYFCFCHLFFFCYREEQLKGFLPSHLYYEALGFSGFLPSTARWEFFNQLCRSIW